MFAHCDTDTDQVLYDVISAVKSSISNYRTAGNEAMSGFNRRFELIQCIWEQNLNYLHHVICVAVECT